MYIHNMNIYGQLPDSISNCEDLGTLIINNTNLTGEIPENIGNLEDLIKLELSNNQLTGIIPESRIEEITRPRRVFAKTIYSID